MSPTILLLLAYAIGVLTGAILAYTLAHRPHREPYELSEWGWVATVRDQAKVRWLRGERDGVAAVVGEIKSIMAARRA